MRITNVKIRAGLAGLALLSSTAMVGTASATHVGCGQVITVNTTLDSDVGPCAGTGIVIGASNITLDLNGHRIVGTNSPVDAGIGVFLNGHSFVVVKNGTISDFDAGVVITNGANNEVSGLTLRNNIPGALAGGDNGEGVAIIGSGSDNNQVLNNTIKNNGPFAGISVYGATAADKITGTVISGNTVVDNKTSGSTGGIRIENWTWNSTVTDNTVKGNALEGIALFADTEANSVSGNSVRGNGFTSETATHRKGDGIRAFLRSDNNAISDNEVFGNAGNGIIINGSTNQILTNDTGGNSAAPFLMVDEGSVTLRLWLRGRATAGDTTVEVPPSSGTYDLQDTNPACDSNTWSGNTYDTAFPDCTKA